MATPTIEVPERLYNIELAYDDTDHFDGFCPVCQVMLLVKKVESHKVVVRDERGKPPEFDRVTHIHFGCPKCLGIGHRKIYWHTNPKRYEEDAVLACLQRRPMV